MNAAKDAEYQKQLQQGRRGGEKRLTNTITRYDNSEAWQMDGRKDDWTCLDMNNGHKCNDTHRTVISQLRLYENSWQLTTTNHGTDENNVKQ